MANTLKFGNGQWATGNGTALAYNDENANFKPLPFNFTRASSGTTVNQSGLIETVGSGIPRIDFQGNTKGALLLEPSRTNLLTYSNDFSNAAWQKVASSTVTANTLISPDGTLNASTFKASSNTYGCILRQLYYGFDYVSTYTSTFYIKKKNYRYVGFRLGNVSGPSGNLYNFFDFDTETVNNTAAPSAELSFEKLTNGWYKLSLAGTPTSSTVVDLALIQSNGSVLNPTGTEEVYIYAAQLEVGSYATSYIPTSGSAVTRVADGCSQTTPDGVIGQTEGTMFIDVDFDTLSDLNMFLSIRPNSSNKIEIYRDGNIIYAETSSSNSFNISKTNITVGRYKIAFAYSSGSSAMYINGVLIGSNTDTFVFTSTLEEIYINSRGTSFIEQSNYNDLKLYNTRLSNSELAALTQV